ncbi:helix-turn-helix domain-containing protein [Streptomyces acidiscabies]|uniref:DNA-binding protein n=1 Tax=Streptomyces acidiscabies TaxID=42234 RepID=A0A0L0JWM4_9ACTN|nr:helix-turn-helix transcriptional regulator [Streptomyces acidiscabies]KND29961.1 DNA-binding protein [Streptomyces acidiscabies]
MPSLDDDHTGTRIAEQRKLARLSQPELADRLPYSYSLLNQVECGAKPATADFVAAVSRVLNIDVTILTGQPYVTEMQRHRLAGVIRPIREALDLYDLGPNPDLTVRPAAELIAEADKLCGQVRAAHLRSVSEALPAAIAELTHTVWTTPSTLLWQTLASMYRTAHDISVKLGYYDLSTVALDRMAWAAERASDPCLGAIRQYMRGLVYFREGEYVIGKRLITSGHGIVGQAPKTRETLAVTGQLHLGASVICARAEDQTGVTHHIDEAKAIAKRIGDASEIHWLSFGPTNVVLHKMSADVEMQQYDTALTEARKMRLPAATATSRRGHFLVDWARTEMETGHDGPALKRLVAARRYAPEQTRYNPNARETVRSLMRTARQPSETLVGMVRWFGL